MKAKREGHIQYLSLKNTRLLNIVLSIALGAIILFESAVVAYNYRSVAAGSHLGLPYEIVLVLAIVEVIGAVLFMVPQTLRFGTIVLLAVFLAAGLVHMLHGQFDVSGLFVDTIAVIAVGRLQKIEIRAEQ